MGKINKEFLETGDCSLSLNFDDGNIHQNHVTLHTRNIDKYFGDALKSNVEDEFNNSIFMVEDPYNSSQYEDRLNGYVNYCQTFVDKLKAFVKDNKDVQLSLEVARNPRFESVDCAIEFVSDNPKLKDKCNEMTKTIDEFMDSKYRYAHMGRHSSRAINKGCQRAIYENLEYDDKPENFERSFARDNISLIVNSTKFAKCKRNFDSKVSGTEESKMLTYKGSLGEFEYDPAVFEIRHGYYETEKGDFIGLTKYSNGASPIDNKVNDSVIYYDKDRSREGKYVDGDMLHVRSDYEGPVVIPEGCKSAKGMFLGNNMDKYDISNIDTKSIEDMDLMFYRAKFPNNSDHMVIDFDTSSAKTMRSMFERSGGYFELGDNFDTSNVSDLRNFIASETVFVCGVGKNVSTLNAKYTDNMYSIDDPDAEAKFAETVDSNNKRILSEQTSGIPDHKKVKVVKDHEDIDRSAPEFDDIVENMEKQADASQNLTK